MNLKNQGAHPASPRNTWSSFSDQMNIDTTALAVPNLWPPSSLVAEQPWASEEPSQSLDSLIPTFKAIFADKALYRRLLSHREAQAQRLLNWFQELLDARGLDVSFRRSLIVAIQRLSEKSALYPTCYHLRDVEYAGDPVAAGSFADIYKGNFRGQSVCVKVIRIYQTSRVEYFLKKCAKEALLWGQLTHPNVCPIYGLYRREARICLVSPWMDNGDLNHYLDRNPHADRLLLMCDAAKGLSYLHESGIVHGDLKGANILVSASGRARLADFGLSSVSDANILAWTSHSSAESKGGSVRWQAPELFDFDNDEAVPNSKASDIYAWSCSCYEAFTGAVPFAHLQRDASVMLQVKSGTTPLRPPNFSVSWNDWGLTESIWSIMTECWKADPFLRPTVDQIIEFLMSEMQPDNRPSDDLTILSPARFREEMSAHPGTVSADDIRQLVDSGSLPRPNPEENPGAATDFQSLRNAYLESLAAERPISNYPSDDDPGVRSLPRNNVTTYPFGNDVLPESSGQSRSPIASLSEAAYRQTSSGGGRGPSHVPPGSPANGSRHQQSAFVAQSQFVRGPLDLYKNYPPNQISLFSQSPMSNGHATGRHPLSHHTSPSPESRSGETDIPPLDARNLPVRERFPCERCGKTFSRAHDRKRHYETQHRVTPIVYRCIYCEREFTRNDSLKKHLNNGCDEQPS